MKLCTRCEPERLSQRGKQVGDAALDFLVIAQNCVWVLLQVSNIKLQGLGPHPQQSCHELASFPLNAVRHPWCNRISASTAQPSCGWVSVRWWIPVRACQMWIDPSVLPEAMLLPSGSHARALIVPDTRL